MKYAPLPTQRELDQVTDAMGLRTLSFVRRILGGLGCTMDVLDADGLPVVLRRYGPWATDEPTNRAVREARALTLANDAGVPTPRALWIDTERIFGLRALIISFVEGTPDLTPTDPHRWAGQLGSTLAAIHAIPVLGSDRELFTRGPGEDILQIAENPDRARSHVLGSALLEL